MYVRDICLGWGELLIQECSQLGRETLSPCCAKPSKQNPHKLKSEMFTFFRTQMSINMSGKIPTCYPNPKYKAESVTLLVSLCCHIRLSVLNIIWSEHFQMFLFPFGICLFLYYFSNTCENFGSWKMTGVERVFCNFNLEDCKLNHEVKDICEWLCLFMIFEWDKIINLWLGKNLWFSASIFFSYQRLSRFPL